MNATYILLIYGVKNSTVTSSSNIILRNKFIINFKFKIIQLRTNKNSFQRFLKNTNKNIEK